VNGEFAVLRFDISYSFGYFIFVKEDAFLVIILCAEGKVRIEERAEIVFWPLLLQIVFPILLYLGREELGIKGILIFVGIWAALFVGLPAFGLPPYFSTVAQVLIDIILVIVVFGGDVKIW